MLDNNDEWEVLTDNGWSDFSGIKITESDTSLSIKLQRNSLTCSFDHRIMTKRGWVNAQQLKIGDRCITKNGYDAVVSIKAIKGKIKLYDLIGVQKESRYYTNNILSHNCDEFAHLRSNLADEFIASVFPTLSSAKSSKLVLISTPKGLNHFHKMWVDASEGKTDFVPVEGRWQENPTRSNEWAEKERSNLGEVRFRQEILCSFEGSSYTLVDGSILAGIATIDPIYSKEKFKIFKKPVQAGSYVVSVDVSRGRHMDYTAFSVIDVSKLPYEVVAIYKDNTISTLELPHLIFNTARQYNNAYILIESNDLGEEVANTLWYEYDYENMHFSDGKNAKGFPGVRTTAKVKSVGCAVLKELVEKEQLIINSHDIIEELGKFAKKHKSYAAEDTKINDDLCTTLWLFSWFTKQTEFQNISSSNIAQILAEKKKQHIDDYMTPFGFFDDGNSTNEVASSSSLPSKEYPLYLTDEQRELLNF
jgi:hypothetical protein